MRRFGSLNLGLRDRRCAGCAGCGRGGAALSWARRGRSQLWCTQCTPGHGAHGAVFSRAGGPPDTGRGSAAGPGHRPDAPGAQSSKRVAVYLVRRSFYCRVCRHRSSVYTTLRGSLRVFSPGLCHAFAACQGGDAQGGPRLPVLIAWAAAGTHPCGPPVAAVAAAAWTLPPVRCRRFYRSSW